MNPVERYLTHLKEIRSTGAAMPETSYYGALEELLNEVGKKLKPKVRCVPQVANTGAGSPDFGLYTADQFQRAKHARPVEGVLPERGVVEVKPTGDDSWVTAKGSSMPFVVEIANGSARYATFSRVALAWTSNATRRRGRCS